MSDREEPETLTRAQMAERMDMGESELAAQSEATRPAGQRILLAPDSDDSQKWQAYCEGCDDRVVKGVSMKSVRSEAARHNQAMHLGRMEIRGLGGLV